MSKKMLEGPLYKSYKHFVWGDSQLSEQEVEELKTVTDLPDSFCRGDVDLEFRKVTKIDLSFFINVQKIGDNSFFDNGKLEELDLRPMTKLKSIGCALVGECISLKTLHFPTSCSIEEIGNSAFYHCISLKELDVSPLQNVAMIGNRWMLMNGQGVKMIGVEKLTKTTSIGDSWLKQVVKESAVKFREERAQGLRAVAQIALKTSSSSVVGKVLRSEYVVFRLTVLFLIPTQFSVVRPFESG